MYFAQKGASLMGKEVVKMKGKECEIMNKFGKFVCKYRVAIIIVALLLLIPSAIGMVATRLFA